MEDIDKDKSYIEKRVRTYISKIEECLFNDSKTILGIDIITDDYTSDGYTNILYHYNPAEYQKYIVEKYFNSDNGLPSLIDTLDWKKHFWVYDIENNEVNGKFKNKELCLEEFSVGIGEANYNRNLHDTYWNKWIETTKEYFGNLKSIIFLKNYFVSEDKSEIKCGLFIYCKDKQLNFLKERGHNRISNLRHFSNNLLNDAFIYSYVDPAKEELRQVALQSAVAQVFARNFAHNIGSHVAIRATNRMAKERIAELYNFKDANNKIDTSKFNEDVIANWLDYMGEKLDLFEVARNEFLAEYKLPAKNAMLYRDVILPFCENTLLMDNIAHSESVHYKYHCCNKLKVKVLINGNEIKAIYPNLSSYYDYNAISYPDNLPYLVKPIGKFTIDEAFATKDVGENDIEICLTNEHTIYSILENLIRNSAKHNKDQLKNLDLIITINIEDEVGVDANNYYKIQIYDNISKVSQKQLNGFADSIKDSLITNDGEIQRKSLGIADIKINAHLLKTDADITSANLSEALTLVYDKEGNGTFVPYGENVKLETKYNFGYQFKLCKPKKVIWIGKEEDSSLKKKGIICIENYKKFKPEGQAKSEEPLANYQFAILELDAVKTLTNTSPTYEWDDFLIKLPHRVLLNCTGHKYKEIENDTAYKWIKELKEDRRIQLVTVPITLPTETEGEKNKDWDFDFLKNCWENWLRKWVDDSVQANLLVCLRDGKEKDWAKFIDGEMVGFKFTFISNSQEQKEIIGHKNLVIFDQHGEGFDKIKDKKKIDFLKTSSYYQFDKNSADFQTFFYPSKDATVNKLFLYEALEAGFIKIGIVDERISEFAYDSNDEELSRINQEKGFKTNNIESGNYFDLCNNGNIFLINHVNEISTSVDYKNINIEIIFNVNKEIDFNTFLFEDIMGVKYLDLDALVIHRTHLISIINKALELIKSGENNFIEDDKIEKYIMHRLYVRYKKVVVISGGGYPHSLKFNVNFKSYSRVKDCFIKYPSKIALNNLL